MTLKLSVAHPSHLHKLITLEEAEEEHSSYRASEIQQSTYYSPSLTLP